MKTTPTTQRYIDLPAIGKKVPLGAYVAAIKAAKANPTKTFKTGLTCWWPCSGAEIVGLFGSVARGEDSPDSDLDLLVTYHRPIGLATQRRPTGLRTAPPVPTNPGRTD